MKLISPVEIKLMSMKVKLNSPVQMKVSMREEEQDIIVDKT